MLLLCGYLTIVDICSVRVYVEKCLSLCVCSGVSVYCHGGCAL